MLYAIPHVMSAPANSNATDMELIATRLCRALESTFPSSSSGSSSSASNVGEEDDDAESKSNRPPVHAATWEAQLVFVNAAIHLIFLERGAACGGGGGGGGKGKRVKKRIVDAVYKWMEVNTLVLPKFCPRKLKERLAKIAVLKKTL